MHKRVAILVRRNYWTTPSTPGNAASHRSVPDLIRAVQRAGGEAELVYQGTAPSSSYAALILPGGGDVHPGFYGQQPEQAHDLDPEFDRFQLNWARHALRKGTPMLGICRGMQVMNVAAGGTLVQDLAGHWGEERAEAAHPLITRPGSELRRLLGPRSAVNSIHHQAIDRPARLFEVTAWAPDGTPEGIESRNSAWQLGVQFHPEDLPALQSLFDRLVQAYS